MHSFKDYETLNVTNYSCPWCLSEDRVRLSAIYLKEHFRNFIAHKSKAGIKLIHFAPEPALRSFLKKLKCLKYKSADLTSPIADDQVDITNMSQYKDESFDFFICSHVLEHVVDDTRAIKKLFRILKPGGSGIIMVPILLSLKKTYEDPTKSTPEDKRRHFGQNDHVRVYSKKDFLKKLANAQFKVRQLDIHYFGGKTYRKYGIAKKSVLYVVERPK